MERSQSQPLSAREPISRAAPGAEPAAAFTPGPWHIKPGDTTGLKTHSGNPGIYASARPTDDFFILQIAVLETNVPAREIEANARLIAAAPDGLEAAMNTYWKLLSLHEVRHLIQPELCGLRDFIAKATGNDPQAVQDGYEAAAMFLRPSASGTTDQTREDS